MPINMRGIETVLEAASRGFQQGLQKKQFEEALRARAVQEQQDFEREETRKKEQADELGVRNKQINAQIEYNKAQLALAQRAANLQALEGGMKIQEKADQMGAAPANAVPVFNPASGITMPDAPVVAPETGTIIETNFADRAKRRGEITLAEQAPLLAKQSEMAKALVKERSIADAENDARTEAREAARILKQQTFERERDQLNRESQERRDKIHYGLLAADRHEARLARAEQQRDVKARLSDSDKKFLSSNLAAREYLEAVKAAKNVVIKEGQYAGKRVADVVFSDTLIDGASNMAGKAMELAHLRKTTPEVNNLLALLGQSNVKTITDAFGKAFVGAEQKLGQAAFPITGEWFTDKGSLEAKVEQGLAGLKRSKVGYVKALDEFKQGALDPEYQIKKVSKWIDLPGGGRKKVEEEE